MIKSPGTLIAEYRDALRKYHADSPDVLARMEALKIEHRRGWFYVDGIPCRRKEIERRIIFLGSNWKEI